MAEASSEESTRSTRDRRPNVTLDNDGIRHEKSLQCRKTRSAAKARITRKIKELTERFSNRENIADVRKGALEFEEIVTNFRDAHSACHATLDDDFEIQDSQEYFECENQRIVNFQRTLEEWFSREEREINPQDFGQPHWVQISHTHIAFQILAHQSPLIGSRIVGRQSSNNCRGEKSIANCRSSRSAPATKFAGRRVEAKAAARGGQITPRTTQTTTPAPNGNCQDGS